jgi:hypothetical protein
MAFVAKNPILGEIDISVLEVVAPGPYASGGAFGRNSFYNEVLSAYDPVLGGAEFIYCKYAGTVSAGQVCEITPSLAAGVLTFSATPWTGTANSGKRLAVAYVSGTAANYGWFQVEGAAVVIVTGSPSAGVPAYFSATGSVQPTAVASKQVLSAEFATAAGVTLGSGAGAVVLSATQAVLTMNRSFAQGAIT